MMAQALHVRPCHRLASGRLAQQHAVPCRPCVRKQRVVVTAGFLNFLTPKSAAPKADERARELAEELVQLCEGTDAGSKATPLLRDEIEELVSQLAPYSIKNPLRSPQLWGTYDVLYCSQPRALGGPLKSGTGAVFFPGQIAQQTLEEPDVLINEITFKSLGFLPGKAKQFGQIQPLSGDTFLLSITRGELSTGIGGPQAREFDVQRKIQIAYLDESLRIARLLPDDDLEDEEAANSDLESQPILFVFRKAGTGQEEEEEEEEEDGEEEGNQEQVERPKSPIAALFGGGSGTRKIEGLATRAERQVRRQLRSDEDDEDDDEEEESPRERRMREQREAAARRQAEAAARKQQQQQQQQKGSSGTAQLAAGRREDQARNAAARRQAEAEARERAQEEKRRAAEEARARAEEEREAQRQRAAAIREQLAELAEELREAQAATKEATAELRGVQRDNAATLKAVSAAKKAVSDAAAETAETAAELEEVAAQRKAAEEALKQAQAAAKQAEQEYRAKVAAALGRR